MLAAGTTSDSLLVFDPEKESGSVFRLPNPMPFSTRGLDGRIDNPNAGWKGRGTHEMEAQCGGSLPFRAGEDLC